MKTIVKRAEDFDIDGTGRASAWNRAPWLQLQPVKGIATYPTEVKILYSDSGLYCLFDCCDHQLTCTNLQDFDRLFNEDVVEAFFWPDQSQRLYLEYELSPLGKELPLMVPNHKGDFMGWIPWQYHGDRLIKKATVIRGGDKSPGAPVAGWSAEIFIPFTLMHGLGNVPPTTGTIWRANFYRIDYDHSEQTLFAWSIGIRNTFHDLEEFGMLEFE